METAFDRWWSLSHGERNEKNKFLAKKAWCYAMKWALMNVYNEKKLRIEIISNKLIEREGPKANGLTFLKAERK